MFGSSGSRGPRGVNIRQPRVNWSSGPRVSRSPPPRRRRRLGTRFCHALAYRRRGASGKLSSGGCLLNRRSVSSDARLKQLTVTSSPLPPVLLRGFDLDIDLTWRRDAHLRPSEGKQWEKWELQPTTDGDHQETSQSLQHRRESFETPHPRFPCSLI